MPRRNRNTSTRTVRRKNDDSVRAERSVNVLTTDQMAARLVVAGLAPAVILHDSSVRVTGNVAHLLRTREGR